MLSRILTAGTLAGTTLLSPLVSPAGAADDAAKATTPTPDARHCVSPAADGAVRRVADAQAACFPTLTEARAAVAGRGEIIVATHFKKYYGQGETHSITAPSCATQWNPAGTWPTTLSSSQVSSACSAAKHYTNADCSGSYQIVTTQHASNLQPPLDNNVGCVKYS